MRFKFDLLWSIIDGKYPGIRKKRDEKETQIVGRIEKNTLILPLNVETHAAKMGSFN